MAGRSFSVGGAEVKTGRDEADATSKIEEAMGRLTTSGISRGRKLDQ